MRTFNQAVNHIEEGFAVVSMIIASILIFVQVVLRYLFNFSLIWSEEAARFLIIWLILVGSSIAVREKGHATVDALVAFLPPAGKKLFSVFANLAGIAFCLILIWAGSEMVSSVVELGNVTPALGVPMAIPYLSVPVGGGLMLFRFLQLLFTDVKRSYSEDEGQPEEVVEK
ncbi:TRAP transporter small permease subunit [Gracilibacillus salitolerans]|uniref:TRAP transporter small permease subunit n=1 Tax=Gracilibacillus salitolerans TaxID=2663022 RepID=A0A5Q2TM08_9BACI|nr:TRAP transporter small permease [Gracilibacillus salitolerans]QGH36014.1 TRAP transporter small permease subunit [Gracilibacillus salitolerans]